MGRFDTLGDAVRALSGRRLGSVAPGAVMAQYPKADALALVTPAKHMPAPGTEIFDIDPRAALRQLAYPEPLAEEALSRLVNNPYETVSPGRSDVVYLRPGTETTPGFPGRAIVQFPRDPAGAGSAVYDLGANAEHGIRLLAHELRHGINTRDLFLKRSAPSVSAAYKKSGGSIDLRPEDQQYFSRPSEMLSYVAEAGDDFVASNNRLVRTPADAAEALEAWAANGGAMADPRVKAFYMRAASASPAVRKAMQDMLMRYFAVPVAATTAANGMMDNND